LGYCASAANGRAREMITAVKAKRAVFMIGSILPVGNVKLL
jgi:hypothetical protein